MGSGMAVPAAAWRKHKQDGQSGACRQPPRGSRAGGTRPSRPSAAPDARARLACVRCPDQGLGHVERPLGEEGIEFEEPERSSPAHQRQDRHQRSVVQPRLRPRPSVGAARMTRRRLQQDPARQGADGEICED